MRLSMKEAHLNYWLHLKRLEILLPMFVGSLLFAVPFALISYWIVEQFLERYKSRRHGPFSQASSRS